MIGWFRPLRRELWSIVPDWRQAHRFMSTQALSLGTVVVTVLLHFNYPKPAVFAALFATAAMTLAGTLIDQPEVHDDK